MILAKSDDFIADVEQQTKWYAQHAPWEIADRYLATVEATTRLLSDYPLIGPRAGFSHPRLRDWRFITMFRPFQKHVLFYETTVEAVVLRRAMHGHRDLPRRLLQPPAAT